MSKFYKVWVHIEEQDTENEDHFESIGQPDELGVFETFEEAAEAVSHIEIILEGA